MSEVQFTVAQVNDIIKRATEQAVKEAFERGRQSVVAVAPPAPPPPPRVVWSEETNLMGEGFACEPLPSASEVVMMRPRIPEQGLKVGMARRRVEVAAVEKGLVTRVRYHGKTYGTRQMVSVGDVFQGFSGSSKDLVWFEVVGIVYDPKDEAFTAAILRIGGSHRCDWKRISGLVASGDQFVRLTPALPYDGPEPVGYDEDEAAAPALAVVR